MLALMRYRPLAMGITIWIILFFASPALASLVPSRDSSPNGMAKDIATIQSALENKLVQEKLHAYGLTAEEVNAKLSSMTPDQIHMLAQASSDVLAGGDAIGFLIGVLIIIILVIIILKLLNKEIIIKYSNLDSTHSTDLPARG